MIFSCWNCMRVEFREPKGSQIEVCSTGDIENKGIVIATHTDQLAVDLRSTTCVVGIKAPLVLSIVECRYPREGDACNMKKHYNHEQTSRVRRQIQHGLSRNVFHFRNCVQLRQRHLHHCMYYFLEVTQTSRTTFFLKAARSPSTGNSSLPGSHPLCWPRRHMAPSLLFISHHGPSPDQCQ